MPRKSNIDSAALTAYISTHFGDEFGADAIRAAADEFNSSYPTICKRLDCFKVGHGKWNLTVQEKLEQTYNAPAAAPAVAVSNSIVQNLIPEKDDTFVQFGNFSDVKKILSSNIFYPVFITGLSGNGKTFSVEQACAQLKRELIRVNITIETDEDDLIGGFRLVDGNTVWHNGPVIEALERGAVLLLDEIDLASNKIMCLQSILEGKGVFLKKTGRYVKPAAGFTVVATANTKGKGSDDGRFIGTNVLNEAFLERFALTFEQEYPTVKTEQKILEKLITSLGGNDLEFCEKLAAWADIIRKTFKDGGIDEVISTRRLSHIIRAYTIFGKRMKAIQVCVNRFDDETKSSFMELYDKIDATVHEEQQENSSEESPF
jgi:Cdc6-like AAA superfamily ATPase